MATLTPPQSNHNTPLRPGQREEDIPSPSTVRARLAESPRGGVDEPMVQDVGDGLDDASEESGDGAESGEDVYIGGPDSEGEKDRLEEDGSEAEDEEGHVEGEEDVEPILGEAGGAAETSAAKGKETARARKSRPKRKGRSNGKNKSPTSGKENLPEVPVTGKETKLADTDHVDRLNRIIGDIVGDYDPSWE